jgi:type IV pilus assembly protein PilY1
VLVFGGGYDPAQDSTYQLADAYGNSIYVVNATTGARVWEITDTGSSTLNIADMDNSIPADVKAIDIDQDGYLDRIYAIDVIGRIFRVDFDNSGSDTTVAGGGLIASLNKPDASSTCAAGSPDVSGAVPADCQRRFYNGLDTAIMTGYPVSPYLQISVGSGYRAHPVSVTGIQDRFYALFDENVLNTVATADYATEYHWTESNLVNVTEIDTSGGAVGETAYSAAASNLQAALTQTGVHGWYLNMEGTEEKVLSESVTLGGKTVFTTYLRDTSNVDVCKPNLGTGRIYVVDSFNGLPIADLDSGTVFDAANTQTPVKDDRFKDLGRAGIPSDPLVVFREDDTGKIVPMIVVSTELPLPPGLFGSNNYVKTWWIDAQ